MRPTNRTSKLLFGYFLFLSLLISAYILSYTRNLSSSLSQPKGKLIEGIKLSFTDERFSKDDRILVDTGTNSNSSSQFEISYQNEYTKNVIVKKAPSVGHGLRIYNDIITSEYLKCLEKSTAPSGRTFGGNKPETAKAYPVKSNSFQKYMDIIKKNGAILTITLNWNLLSILSNSSFRKEKKYSISIAPTFTSTVCAFINKASNKYHHLTERCVNNTDYRRNNTVLISEAFFNHGSFYHKVGVYFHILRNAHIDNNGVTQTEQTIIVPFGCKGDRLSFTKPRYGYKKFGVVFVLSQFWGGGFFHFNIEGIPRMMPCITLLRNHTNIYIHIGRVSSYAKAVFTFLGIDDSRLISGPSEGEIVLLPPGGGCGNPVPLNIILLALEYHMMANEPGQTFNVVDGIQASVDNGGPEQSKSIIILIKRNFKRGLRQHDAIEAYMYNISQHYNLEFVVYSDINLPGFTETLNIFRKCFLVVAPHGAGLSHIVHMKRGSAVVEILCRSSNINFCYSNLAGILGLHYHGILAKRGCEGGMTVDLKYLYEVIEYHIPHPLKIDADVNKP